MVLRFRFCIGKPKVLDFDCALATVRQCSAYCVRFYCRNLARILDVESSTAKAQAHSGILEIVPSPFPWHMGGPVSFERIVSSIVLPPGSWFLEPSWLLILVRFLWDEQFHTIWSNFMQGRCEGTARRARDREGERSERQRARIVVRVCVRVFACACCLFVSEC